MPASPAPNGTTWLVLQMLAPAPIAPTTGHAPAKLVYTRVLRGSGNTTYVGGLTIWGRLAKRRGGEEVYSG